MTFQRPTPLSSHRDLSAAAAAFKASSNVLAIDPGRQALVLSIVDAYLTGGATAPLLAGYSETLRPTAPRAPQGTAVLSLTGILTPSTSLFTLLGFGTSLRQFGMDLSAAVADSSVKSIAIVVDSPGGQVGLVPELAAQIRSARATKPVHAFVTGLNCSAAYWVTAGCSSISATPSALIGSIGVYGLRVSIVKQLEREGIDVEVFSAGRFKTEGLPMTTVTDDERRAQMAYVGETYSQFVSDVATGRGTTGTTVRAGYGEGRAVSAKEAKRLGMIDHVAALEQSLAQLTSGSGLRAQHTSDADERERIERMYSRF